MRLWSIVLALGLSLLAATRAHAQDNAFSDCLSTDAMRSDGMGTVLIPGRPGRRVTLTGAVSIPCRNSALFADQVVFETDTHQMIATGNVLFQQAGLQIFADRAEMNGATKLGTFYGASGYAQVGNTPQEKSLFGTLEPHVHFEGARVEKAGPDVYRITNARFTTCVQANPRWEMSGTNATITLDKYALLRNVVLRVKSVPLLYLPAIYYPINKEDRSTGFLLPSYGSSSVLGSSISNAFFLAINRSQDATFFHDWYPQGGQGFGTEYRYVTAPGSEGRVNVHLLDAPDLTGDDGTSRLAQRSYRIDGGMNQSLPRGFRLFAEANFFTDPASQQLHQDVAISSNREQLYKGTLTGAIGRYRIFATAEQRDFFFGGAPGQRTGRGPYGSVTASDKPIGRSLVYAGYWVEGGRVIRQNNVDDALTDQGLWRLDGSTNVRLPLSRLSYLSATASAGWRVTHWFESRDPITGAQVPMGLTRQLLETRASVVGPVLSRVFQTPGNGYAERFKHLIEPAVTLQWTSPFEDFRRVVINEQSIDGVVGGNTTVTYRLTNRLMARLAQSGVVREILSVDVNQTFYTDARAAFFDPQYQQGGVAQLTRTRTFSPIRLEATARPVDRASGTFRMEIDSTVYAVRHMWANGTLHGRNAQLTGGWSKQGFIPGLPGFDNPGLSQHFLTAGTTIRTSDNRVGASYSVYYDVRNRFVQQQRIVAHYNSQCCGVAFDWQSRGLQLVGFQSDRTWGVSFTLAGIGSFSNSLGSFGGR